MDWTYERIHDSLPSSVANQARAVWLVYLFIAGFKIIVSTSTGSILKEKIKQKDFVSLKKKIKQRLGMECYSDMSI